MVGPLIHRRAANDFAPSMYYTFHNAVDPNNTLSSGQNQNTKGAVSMTTFGDRSSENWQLYYQQGRYFIRNYDYLGSMQLGLDEGSLVPKLMKRSGALAQQWTMTRQSDGTFRFTNGMLGNDSALALVKGNTMPAMQPSGQGTAWEILANPSALAPKDPSMLVDVTGFEVEQVSSSSISSSATSTSTSSPTASGATKSGSIASATSSPTHALTPSADSKSSLAPGAIAGIAIGVVLLLALCALLGYFLWARRKPKVAKNPAELESSPTDEHKSYYAHHGEIGGEHVAHQPQQQHTYAHHNQLGVPASEPESPSNRYEMGDTVAAQEQKPIHDVKLPYSTDNRVSHRAELG